MKSYVLIPITIVSIVLSWFIWTHAPEYIRRGGPLLVAGLTFLFLTLTFAVERFIVLWRAGEKAERKDLMDETRRALQEANALESPNLEQNLNALSTIASIATMLGLLGTTIGMIRSFHAMSRAGAPDATQLALGISEALVNTALGLTTAIIATVLYNYFTTKVDTFNNRVEETSYEVLKLLELRKES